MGDTQTVQEGHGAAELSDDNVVILVVWHPGEQELIQIAPVAVLHHKPQG